MDNIKQPLKNLGFSEKEVHIYMALLELGDASYTDLARASGIKRTTLYPIIDDLRERGIVRYLVDQRHLAATPPEELFQQLQANALQFHRLLPQLKVLGKKQRSISRVQFFNGTAGIKRAYLEGEGGKLTPVKDRIIRVISDGETWERFWETADPGFTKAYLQAAQQKHFRWKILAASGLESVYSLENGKQYGFEAKRVPPEYKSEFDMEIHRSYLILADLKNEQPYAIKIISTELAQALTNFFEFSWHATGTMK